MLQIQKLTKIPEIKYILLWIWDFKTFEWRLTERKNLSWAQRGDSTAKSSLCTGQDPIWLLHFPSSSKPVAKVAVEDGPRTCTRHPCGTLKSLLAPVSEQVSFSCQLFGEWASRWKIFLFISPSVSKSAPNSQRFYIYIRK